MTPEQKEKAIKTLLKQEGIDYKKYQALQRHIMAQNLYRNIGLPYKVILDYLRQNEGLNDIVKLNPCYPSKGFKTNTCIEVNESDFNSLIVEFYDYGNPVLNMLLNDKFVVDNLDTLKKQKVEETIRQNITWKVFDDTWKKIYLRFLIGYDFNSFTDFDFIGKKDAMTSNDLELMKIIFKDLQEECLNNKSKYLAPLFFSKDNSATYQEKPFILISCD